MVCVPCCVFWSLLDELRISQSTFVRIMNSFAVHSFEAQRFTQGATDIAGTARYFRARRSVRDPP